MRKKNAFRFEGLEILEGRQVLNAAVLTTGTLNSVINNIHGSLVSFLQGYQRDIRTVRVDSNGNPNPTDVDRFFTSLNHRTQILSNQVASQAFRIPFGGQNLAPVFQNEVANLGSELQSVSSIDQALHPGAATQQTYRFIREDLQSFVTSEVNSGNIVVRGRSR